MFRFLTALALFVLSPNILVAAPIEGAMSAQDDSVSAFHKVVIAMAANLKESSNLSANPYGLQLKRGIDLALSESITRLKDAGLQIEIQEFDTHGSYDDISNAAHKVMESEAKAVIGHVFSSEALVAGEIYGKEGPLLFVSPGATADSLQDVGTHIVSTVFNNLKQANVLAEAAVEKGFKTAAILSVKDCAYCESLKVSFEVEARRTDPELEVVSIQEILSDDEDLESRIDTEELTGVDVIILPNYESVNAKLIHFLNSKNIKPKYYMGGDGWGLSSEIFRQLVAGIEFNALTLGYWAPNLDGPEANDFRERFKNKFDSAPTDVAIMAYDGMNRLIEIILKSETPVTRESLMELRKEVRSSNGALGKIETNEWDVARPYVILDYEALEIKSSHLKRNILKKPKK